MSTLEDFENWAVGTLLPSLNPTERYNGDAHTDWKELRLYTLGGNYYRVGNARFRQLRVKHSKGILKWTTL